MGNVKYAGPSKEMMDALEAEGLYVSWPSKVEGEEDLAVEGMYHTGGGEYEKLVLIDLRGKSGIGTNGGVDSRVAGELREAFSDYSVDDEVRAAIGTRGAPGAAALVRDCEEARGLLKRFAEVAEAVANGKPAPKNGVKNADGETVHITPSVADGIVFYLRQAYKTMNTLGKSDISIYCNELLRKMGRPEVKKWD